MCTRVAKPPSLLYIDYRAGSTTGSDYLAYTSHGAILNTKSSITYASFTALYPPLCYQPLCPLSTHYTIVAVQKSRAFRQCWERNYPFS